MEQEHTRLSTTALARKLNIPTQQLFQGHQEIVIDHKGESYRLRITKNDKLIERTPRREVLDIELFNEVIVGAYGRGVADDRVVDDPTKRDRCR